MAFGKPSPSVVVDPASGGPPLGGGKPSGKKAGKPGGKPFGKRGFQKGGPRGFGGAKPMTGGKRY